MRRSEVSTNARFSTVFPLELETRISPTEFAKFIERLNQPLREAYSTSGAVWDNVIAVLTWWTSLMWRTSHFEKVSCARVLLTVGAVEGRGDNLTGERHHFQCSWVECTVTSVCGFAICEL